MSTPTSRAHKGRHASLLALLTSFFVGLSGLLIVPAASAAGAEVTASVTSVTAEAVSVNATVTGITLRTDAAEVPDTGKADMGVYVAVITKGNDAELASGGHGLASQFAVAPTIRDGVAHLSLEIDTGDLDRNIAYEVVSWRAHGVMTPERYLARTDLVFTPEEWNVIDPLPVAENSTIVLAASATTVREGESVDLVATVTPTDALGTVSFFRGDEQLGDAAAVADGTATVVSGTLDVGDHTFTARFTPADEALVIASMSEAVTVVASAQQEEEPPHIEWSPALSVHLADGTQLESGDAVYDGEELVVKGSGFDPLSHPASGRPPLSAGDPSGNYVVFGNFADDWRPSGGAGTAARSVADQKWALTDATFDNINPVFVNAVVGSRVVLSADGTFEARLTAGGADATPGSYGVFTYVAGGGAHDVTQELELRLTLKKGERPAEAEWAPAIDVYEADGITKLNASTEVYDGDKIIVKGTGFDPEANIGGRGVPIPNTLPQGSYVVFGNFADEWRPSEGVASSQRVAGPQAWVLTDEVLDQVPSNFQNMVRAQWAELKSDGSFEAPLELAPLTDRDGNAKDLPEGGSYGIYTYAAGGMINPDQELSFALNYQGEKTPGETDEDGTDDDGNETEPGDTDGNAPTTGGLEWSFKSSWNMYLDVIASGERAVRGGAMLGDGGSATFVPAPGSTYDAATGLGTVKYAGMLIYSSEFHGFEIAVSDPWVEFTKGSTTLTAQVSTDDTAGASSMKRIPMATLAQAKPTTVDGVLRWNAVKGTFHERLQPESWEQYVGEAIDPLTFSFDPEATPEAPEPTEPVAPKPKPQPKPQPKPTPAPAAPARSAQAAGSLTWGISTEFANYVRGNIARGGITTNGVGGGAGAYVFPQATGGSWNPDTHTGTVRYSGVVTFTGHHGQLTESASNPVITVTSATSATLSTGGRTFGLNLGAASKRVGTNGEVTWSGVPVSGGFSFGSHSLRADGLTFTVGAASNATHGSSSAGTPQQTREVPDTPPAVSGVTVVTDAEKIRPGATIEIEAEGFQPNEWGIMAVIYSEPTVLDTDATADEHGVVRWIGTLPEDLEAGTHTITLQGSISVGTEIEVLGAEAEARTLEVMSAEVAESDVQSIAAEMTDDSSTGLGGAGVWIGVGVLVLLAAGGVALVAMQRRRAASV